MIQPKKHLGQHFLTDKNIALKIVQSLDYKSENKIPCIEIGPGKGILTQFLMQREDIDLYLVEIDYEAVNYMNENFKELTNKIINADILKYNLNLITENEFVIIGNFPYNISSQIFFKILENKTKVKQTVCMIQKEVAERIASKEGNKTYGILSVLLQAFYDIEYLFTVNEGVFLPPPKVKSAVIRLNRKTTDYEIKNQKTYFTLVKLAFSHRRKTLRNNLKDNFDISKIDEITLGKRAEQLSVLDFVELSNLLSE